MRVTEIFRSIQGEGTRAGRPCAFVRFTGCDLRCTWCDTAHAFQGGEERSRQSILAELDGLGLRHVCLTGGEPLLQAELPELCRDLIAGGWEVTVETHGQRDAETLPAEVARIFDVKPPGSGVPASDFAYLDRLRPHDEVKFVVASEGRPRQPGPRPPSAREFPVPRSVEEERTPRSRRTRRRAALTLHVPGC
jgi:7-carboxy-7-deazaguanine synthase